MLACALASAGDVVAVERPTRHVALAAFAAAGLSVLGIPLARAIRERLGGAGRVPFVDAITAP